MQSDAKANVKQGHSEIDSISSRTAVHTYTAPILRKRAVTNTRRRIACLLKSMWSQQRDDASIFVRLFAFVRDALGRALVQITTQRQKAATSKKLEVLHRTVHRHTVVIRTTCVALHVAVPCHCTNSSILPISPLSVVQLIVLLAHGFPTKHMNPSQSHNFRHRHCFYEGFSLSFRIDSLFSIYCARLVPKIIDGYIPFNLLVLFKMWMPWVTSFSMLSLHSS